MEHMVVSESLFHSLDLEDVSSTVPNLLEAESRITAGAGSEFDQPFRPLLDHAHLALRLARFAGLGTEAIHEFLMMRDLAFPGGNSLLPAFALGLLRVEKSCVIAVIEEY